MYVLWIERRRWALGTFADAEKINTDLFFFQSIEELEKEMLNGQKLQGPLTSAEVYHILKQKGLVDKYV